MQKIAKFINSVKNKTKNKFLYCVCLISFIFALTVFCLLFKKAGFAGILYFIPVLIAFVICIVSIHLSKNLSKPFKTAVSILSAAAIFVIQFYFTAALFFISHAGNFNQTDKVYNDAKSYNEAIKSVKAQSYIKHFPPEIPSGAKNIKLHKNSNSFFGSEWISLSFEINNYYINKELKKYNFIETKNNKYNPVRDYAVNNLNLDKTNFKFYVIGNNSTDKSGFPLEYGIAVNNKTNTILYYYECID